MENDNGVRPKKKYEAPQIAVINLRPEEAVLGSCKSSGAGPGGTCGVVGTCPTAGS